MDKLAQPPTLGDYLKVQGHPLRRVGGSSSKQSRFHSLRPLVTVFTIILNSKEALPSTIKSVFNQSYQNIEYLIVDGASTDGTLEVIEEFNDKIDLWISEPDLGTADATNKAISMAKGELVFWLPAGDWIEPDFINIAVEAILRSGADFVFGDIIAYKNNKIEYVVKGENISKGYISPLLRQNFSTWVMKVDCFKKAGLLDLKYRFCCDFEWSLRLRSHGIIGFYENQLILHFMGGGISDKHYLRSNLEALRAMRYHGQPMVVASTIVLYAVVRTFAGRLTKLLLPNFVYVKLVSLVRRNSLSRVDRQYN